MAALALQSDRHWHELRARHVGASEVGALFGEHPHLTHFELWHIKAGLIPAADLSDNERVFWGRHLEPAIAAGVQERKGWVLLHTRHQYYQHPTVAGMGATLDYEIVGDPRGQAALEIKTVDGYLARQWAGDEPPLHFDLQLQHQLAVTGYEWGALAILVGGNDLRVYERERRPAVTAKLEAAVAAFWATVAAGTPPKPDFLNDVDAIRQLHGAAGGGTVDMGTDNRLVELAATYCQIGAVEKQAKTERDAIKAEILTKIGNADRVLAGQFSISAKEIAAAEIAYTRKPYRDFRIFERT